MSSMILQKVHDTLIDTDKSFECIDSFSYSKNNSASSEWKINSESDISSIIFKKSRIGRTPTNTTPNKTVQYYAQI